MGCAVPAHDFHRKFVEFAPRLLADREQRQVFARMAERCRIAHRFSCLVPSSDPSRLDAEGFYRCGEFPDTAHRMVRYEREALPLAERAVADLGHEFAADKITHLLVVSCTGFAAPGLDLQLAARLGLAATVERTMIGFMGCSAAIPALRLARHIVRSDETACVLVVAVELCSLHLQESDRLEELLSFLHFADGCAAAVVSARPFGIAIEGFDGTVLPQTADHITWRIGAGGFEMHLSGRVPGAILRHLREQSPLPPQDDRGDTLLWAVHPGGRSVLDAVEAGLALPPDSLSQSRRVLRDCGNMSSASVLFVLREIMEGGAAGPGCAMAFGPGVAVETMRFRAPR
ncbi:MAG TPA: type III polyketide synthase [Stellaceae bacterium]|nr:type III polyketide synthase [Stellaceae bacterium]